MKKQLLCITLASLSACTYTSSLHRLSCNLTELTDGSYSVSRERPLLLSYFGTPETDNMLEASTFCANSGKTPQVLAVTPSQTPYFFGELSQSELHFKCR